MRRHRIGGIVVAVALLALTACGGGGGTTSTSTPSNKPATLHVAYWSGFNPPGVNIMPSWIGAAATELQQTHPNVKVSLDEITTNSESEYYAKLDLAERSSSTAPDVAFEDSFLIGSDASAGYIRPLPELTTWSGWPDYFPAMQKIVTYNGQVYGAMNSTDVQLVFYNKALLQKAGIPVPWQPHSWNDVVHAADAIKRADSSVVPLWIYAGQENGEAASFRGFQVFLNGTNDRLYDEKTQKWEVSGPGFDATWNYLESVRPYIEPESQWSSPMSDATVALNLIPAQNVGIVFDGSWVATAYVPGSLKPCPGFFTSYGWASLPTQSGQGGGYTNLSGGWALSVPQLAKHPDLSTELIELASSPQNLAPFDAKTGNLPPRRAVLTEPAWIQATKINPVFGYATKQIPYTTFRPLQPAYVQVSNEIAKLTGDIASGNKNANDAAREYESVVTGIVGAANVERMTS
ncbi:MAG TPA: extracellular solute-binding protein [Acidimicrobiia bacterium]|nr:extracellular solute-binding protein [Acidimicrobiia bacterium]